ncbi:hypothetical protein FRACA_490001 [Frankia canadensis]|uniref:PknH-like extracellular domain-containing protein n=1 Tax=Frankia canadensis TaxID=1836972 RepID=A0A2I2KY34_9ACTN|nr:hypothetical protein FRACA_490001 [Frankia canadensis]SOU57859.1 hypothetical protein FRACA_490001 [Frankia canadensis]
MLISIVAALALTPLAAWRINEGLGERAVPMPKPAQTAPRSPDFAPSRVPSEEALKAAILSATDFPGWRGTENPFSVDSLQLCGHAAKVKSATNTAGRLFIEGSQIYGGISVQSGATGFVTDRDAINFMSEVQSRANSCVSWPKKDVTLQVERVERARFGEESIRVSTTTQSGGIPAEIQFVYIRRESTIALLYYRAGGGYLAKPELDESSVDHFADILDSRIRTIN